MAATDAAADLPLTSLGLVVGRNDPQRNIPDELFQAEVVVVRRLGAPRRWGKFMVRGRFLTSAGFLRAGHDTGLLLSTGPGFAMTLWPWLDFVGAFAPTLLTDYRLGGDDLGGRIQFSTHLGFVWRPTRQWSVGYRLQHMSNANIFPVNPGLDMHLIQTTVGF